MTPTQLADYVALNLGETQPEIDEFVERLNSKVSELPEATRVYIFDAIESKLMTVPCKKHPS
jgi:hypothetical protein